MKCIEELKVESSSHAGEHTPYNFILTKDWMMMVIRKRPEYSGIYCNSLGIIGVLFAKDE